MVNYIYIILAVGIVLLIVIITWLILRLRKSKARKNAILEDVLVDYEKAEQMMKNSKGTMSPQEILWKIYKDKDTIQVEQPAEVPIIVPQETMGSLEFKSTKPKSKLARLFGRRRYEV